jgi:uncharacterized protein (TIGR03435 family)
MQPAVRLILGAAALASAAMAQHAGDVPPALVWDKLKGNCPAKLDWASLHGKVVVVAFSSDAAVPDDVKDWNELPEKFTGEPVVFIQVAGGSEFLLDQALKKIPYQGCVLFDSKQTNHRNFRALDLTTVIVDGQGWIAGYGQGGIEEETVRSVLAHEQTADLAETPPQPGSSFPLKLDGEPSWEVHISPATKVERPALGRLDVDRYIARDQALKSIIMDLWDKLPSRIEFPVGLDEARYDVSAYIPVSDEDLLLRLVREAIERHFGLNVRKETRTERVYVLTAVQIGSQLRPAKDTENWMIGGSQQSMIGTAQTMPQIARAFEGRLRTPVIDQTGLPGKYDYSATSELKGPDAFLDMAHQLGLQLTELEKAVEILVVRKF